MEHADALIAYRTYPHVDMADTGRACCKAPRAVAEDEDAFCKGVPAIAVPDPDLLAMHQRPADQGHLRKARRRWKATRCRPCRFAPGFPAADFRDCGPSVFAYGRTQADADAAADKIVALVESHEDDFDGRIYSPDDGVRLAMELAKIGDQADHHRRHPGQSGAGGDSRHHGHAARAGAQQRVRRRAGVIYDPQSAKAAHARPASAPQSRWSSAASPAYPGDAPYKETFVVEKLSGRKVRGVRPLLRRARHGYGAVGLPAHRRRQCGRELLQGATRRPVDVPLCRHRADRTENPGQQELGAFPGRFRADRRKAPDLRRARRDAGRYGGTALDAAASGHPHQAERPCLHPSRLQSRSTSSVTG